MTEDDEIIYNTPNNTPVFTIDNQTVHCTLNDLTTYTDYADWIKTHILQINVKNARISMCEHYNGTTKSDKRVAISRSSTVKMFYKYDTTFSFEKYSIRLERSFDMLQQYGQTKRNK